MVDLIIVLNNPLGLIRWCLS